MLNLRSKTCKYCKQKFAPIYNSLQYVCSPKCASLYAKIKHDKERIDKMKENVTTTKDLLKVLTLVFNKYIRLRDKDLPCISCDKIKCEEWHSGHYIPSTYSIVRYDEFNVNKQCSECNTHLSGNLVFYRKGLIKKIGIESVEWLEEICRGQWKPNKETIKELILVYKKKLKDNAA